jgi:transcriptional regulator of acetoin/glycerol metabolism
VEESKKNKRREERETMGKRNTKNSLEENSGQERQTAKAQTLDGTITTRLEILPCCESKNDDGTPNAWRGIFLSFIELAIDEWSSEMQWKKESSVEWAIPEPKQETLGTHTFLLTGTPQDLLRKISGAPDKDARFSCIAVLRDNQWDENLNNLLQNPRADVLLVVRGKVENVKDFQKEDILQFSGVLKRLARLYLRASNKSKEEEQSKNIAWKCRINTSDLADSSFISFFSDPAMTIMGREMKTALLDVDRRTRGNDGNKRELKKVHSILLLGETGTGKTLVAQWIAQQLFPKEWERGRGSEPNDMPFISVNVSTLPKNMVDVELFGAFKGAFTDAMDHEGLLIAHEGKVIFLDEIGEMEPESQARLLKYLDNGEVRRVGGNTTERHFSVIVAATNRPLDQWARMENAPFRADLYYRFEHVVKIPSLKERKKDMRLLISILLQDPQLNELVSVGNEKKHRIERISLDAIEYLEKASYPGNFRDLRSRVRAGIAIAIAEGASTLCLRHLTRI